MLTHAPVNACANVARCVLRGIEHDSSSRSDLLVERGRAAGRRSGTLPARRVRHADPRRPDPAFEFTYELSHKLLKRYLENVSASPGEYDAADFQYLIRSGNEEGLLLGDWPVWRNYRDMRSKTSHTHDEKVALEVVEGIAPFLNEARHLLQQISAGLHP